MITRLPEYLKTKIASVDNKEYKKVKDILKNYNLNTVCNEARCPNKCQCFSNLTATFLILGKNCTRNCAFCNVSENNPDKVNEDEPINIALAIRALGLKYCVITSVTRDDLVLNHDFGSIHYCRVIEEIRKNNPDVKVEILVPDFKGDITALNRIANAKPDVFNHNIETIKRLYPVARQMADFDCSCNVLKYMKSLGFITKSGFMLGLGEDINEVYELIDILNSINLDIVTIGQYIQPSKKHLPVSKYYSLDEYAKINEYILKNTSIMPVVSPLARSSYKAYETYLNITKN